MLYKTHLARFLSYPYVINFKVDSEFTVRLCNWIGVEATVRLYVWHALYYIFFLVVSLADFADCAQLLIIPIFHMTDGMSHECSNLDRKSVV